MDATISRATVSEKRRASWWRRHAQSIFTYFAFFVFLLVIGVPFYYIFISSVTPSRELFQIPPSYFPSQPTFDNYANMASSIPLLTYFRNSAIFAVSSAFVSVAASGLAAYALARIKFRGSSLIYLALIMSVALPQIAVLVPMFQTFQTFKLVNTHHGLIIMMSSLMLPFTIMSLDSFIRQIPGDIEEAATIDGASTFQILVQIMLPLLRPALFTMFVINFIISWNEFLYPFVFAQRIDTKPLSVGLMELTSDASTMTRPWDLMSSLSVLMIVPVLIIVLFGQRMIIGGLARGAVK